MIRYFLYLLEASICLSLFYLVYWFFIKDDTFHRLKRYYLLISVIISLVIPVLPASYLTKNIEKSILPLKTETLRNLYSQNAFEKILFTGLSIETSNKAPVRNPIAFFSVLFIPYCAGVIFMFFRLLYNLIHLTLLIKRNIGKPYGKYFIIILPEDYPTFSFFRYIFLNQEHLNPDETADVLLHESTHIKQWHSADIIFIELCKIFFWFLPVIWQYKSSLSKVHECLADEHLVEIKSANIHDYQSLLLKQYLSNIKIELAHPFNYSLIKFRINMMTKTKSKWWAKYKLVFALPVIVLGLLAFTNDNFNARLKESSLQTNLNQTELFKKFIGTWEMVLNKDTVFTFVAKSINNGVDLYLKEESNGTIMIEQKGIMEYDSNGDRFIQKNPLDNNQQYPIAMWFSSDSLCEAGMVSIISDPARVPVERKWEFKSPDLLILSVKVDDKFLQALVLKRKII
jgi:hypothetical protein